MEEPILPENSHSSCRFCLKSNIEEKFALFIDQQPTDLHEILKLLNIIVNYEEILPNYICGFCKVKIDAFVAFKDLIAKNEGLLRKSNEDVICEETDKIVFEDVKLHSCNICGIVFTSEVRMSLHYIQHVMFIDEEKVDLFLFCNYCGLIVNSEDEYINHVKDKHVYEMFNCQDCNEVFRSEFLLTNHMHCNNPCKKVNFGDFCSLCRKEISGSLSSHLKTHLVKRFTCPICKEKYITSIAYNYHLAKHPQYKYKCVLCYRMFLSKKNIDKHLKEIHNNSEFVCDICSKIFNRKHNLTLHKRQKHDEKNKNFICSLCAYATKSNSELRKHERMHSNERPFKCTFVNCDKAYKTSSHLSHHVKIHLTLKNFVCQFCDKSFYTSKNLKHHILSHTGVRDFKCNLCDKMFKRRDQLIAHMRKRHACISYTYQDNT